MAVHWELRFCPVAWQDFKGPWDLEHHKSDWHGVQLDLGQGPGISVNDIEVDEPEGAKNRPDPGISKHFILEVAHFGWCTWRSVWSSECLSNEWVTRSREWLREWAGGCNLFGDHLRWSGKEMRVKYKSNLMMWK